MDSVPSFLRRLPHISKSDKDSTLHRGKIIKNGDLRPSIRSKPIQRSGAIPPCRRTNIRRCFLRKRLTRCIEDTISPCVRIVVTYWACPLLSRLTSRKPPPKIPTVSRGRTPQGQAISVRALAVRTAHPTFPTVTIPHRITRGVRPPHRLTYSKPNNGTSCLSPGSPFSACHGEVLFSP